MDDQKIRIFNAMSSFVQDLNGSFGKRYKPVALYNRLIERTTIRDINAIDRHITAFKTFFNNNQEYITQQKLGDNTLIVYSPERIYLDMGKILHKISDEEKKIIHQHLVIIYSLLNLGSKESKDALESLKNTQKEEATPDLNLPDTNEGQFLKKTLNTMTDHFKNIDTENANPMQLMSSMMQSGFLTDFVNTLQTEFSSGKMNIGSLIKTVSTVITDNSDGAGPQITDLLTNSMASLGVGAEMNNPHVKELMESLQKKD